MFKKSAKKETQQDAAALTKVEEVVESTKAVVEPVAVEPAVEPAAAEDTVEALPEVKAELVPAKDDASTVAESVDDRGDAAAPAPAEAAVEEPPAAGAEAPVESKEETLEVIDVVMPAAIAVDDVTEAKPAGWFSCAVCK